MQQLLYKQQLTYNLIIYVAFRTSLVSGPALQKTALLSGADFLVSLLNLLRNYFEMQKNKLTPESGNMQIGSISKVRLSETRGLLLFSMF